MTHTAKDFVEEMAHTAVGWKPYQQVASALASVVVR